MKSEAFFLTKYGEAKQAFQLQVFELESLSSSEVLIEVEAFGLNYADVMARNKLYREAPPLPCVLGYEVVGRIIQVGNTSSNELIGKRVLAFCRFGGYAKHVKVPNYAFVEIEDLEATKALALATQYVTAFYMLSYLAPVRQGEKVLIHAAAGGVGIALIQLCKSVGATVYAKVSSQEKVDFALQQGADFAINYKLEDYSEQLRSLLKGEKLDAIFNPVGGSTFKKDKQLLDFGGRLFLFGGSELLGGKFGFFSSLNFLRKMGLILPIGLMMGSKNLLGVNMLKIADYKPAVLQYCLQEVLQLLKSGMISPVQGTLFSNNEMETAHNLLESGKSIGKIGVYWL